ncbi:copper resistance protein CopC [Actinoplanes sp. TRM 88003]|uniref:Copper resistance protein CopC n=1 Tax=Paractinoplanes aksuensis TaxID=2939490 RepID=A0ABT1DVU7_9ACTN|nr:copper resistance protein CopC [Actinoplanes aksuensis]MCO8274970.1 copper resistance protein CopC [Actinoplanes aksuensis]
MGLFHRVVLAVSAVVVVVFAVPSPAAAHGTLGMSVPAGGATVSAPLDSVELFFTEKVPDNAFFTVTAPDGGRVDNGWEHAGPRPLDKPVTEYFMEGGKFEPRQYTTGFPARVRIAHLPVTGEYKVGYQSRASDGDNVHGTVTFKYTGPATPAPAGWTPPTDQADPALLGGAVAAGTAPSAAAPVAAPEDGGTNWLGWLGGIAASALVVVGLIFWRRRPAGSAPVKSSAKKAGATKAGATTAGSIPVVPIAVGAVVVALIGGYGLGRATAAPPESAAAPAPVAPMSQTMAGHQHGGGDGGAATVEAAGTTVSSGGYTLQPVRRSQPAGRAVDYAFRIVGADRQPATRFAVVHDKPLHLVVAGRDLAGFQHLHPTMSADGLWSVPLALPRAGAYRIFADFSVATAEGATTPLVLGVDHHVPGAATGTALPAAATRAPAGPFAVTMEGTPQAGTTVPISFRVTRSGAPGPATLERYLGAYGHLVVLREGDLGYVHVHPDPELADGAIRFNVSVPGAGRYRAFLEFQVAGKVERAEFTLDLT